MEKENKNLFYLHDLPDYKIAKHYPDIRGWKVEDREKRIIGEVTGLLVNKEAEKVVYVDVKVDDKIIEEGHEPLRRHEEGDAHEFVNKEGEDHVIIPIGLTTLYKDQKMVATDQLNYNSFVRIPRYNKETGILSSYEYNLMRKYAGKENLEEYGLPDENFYNREEFKVQ